MASSCEASCISDPNFAVICAFLERFASSCGIEFPTFVDLQEMLENVDQVPQELVDLHIKLLRKARKTVFIEKWERALIKFCHTYSSQDGWEIERFGYKKSRLEVKIRVLKMLLEGQFDLNQKFKAQINTQESGELRTKPLGKDKLGRLYWLQTDPVSNIRVYREDMDEESWTLVAKDRPSLVELLQELSGESPLDLNLLNEDSASLDVDKPVTDTGQNANESVKAEDGNEKVGVNGEVNGDAQEQPLNGVSEKNETLNGVSEEETLNGDANKDRVNDDVSEEPEVGEAIEEPVMYVTGEGAGAECETGNPDKEEEQSESVEESTPNTSEHDVSIDKQKPAPKLWSIDTICGVNSAEVNEVKHKNFSSFSIDSVLEKKDSDATVSKYTVNCPFESNSVGGEQTSDVSLKTETNSDAVPYREPAVSESNICTSSEEKNRIESNSETAVSMDTSEVRLNTEEPPVSSKSDTDISKKLDNNPAKDKSDGQETSAEVEEIKCPVLIESTSNSETEKSEETAKSEAEKIIEKLHESETKTTEDEEKDSSIPIQKTADNKSKKFQENTEIINQESQNEVQTMTSAAVEQETFFEETQPTPVREKEELGIDVPKTVEEKIESLDISDNSKGKEQSESSPDIQTEIQLENQSMEINEKIPLPEMTIENAVEQEISKTDTEKPEQKETSKTIPTKEENEIIKEDVAIKEETTEIREQNVPEKIKFEEIKIEEAEITEVSNSENSTEKESEKKLQEKIDLKPTEIEVTKRVEKPDAIEEAIKLREEGVELPAEAESEAIEIDQDEKIAHEKSVKDEQANVEEMDPDNIKDEPVLKDEKIEEKKIDVNIQNMEEEKLESIEKAEEKEEELHDPERKEPAILTVTKKSEELPETEINSKVKEEEKLTKNEFHKDIKRDDVKIEKLNDENLTHNDDGVAKQEDIKKEAKEVEDTDSENKGNEDKTIKRELVVAIEKIETVPDIQTGDEKETDNDKSIEDTMGAKNVTKSSAKSEEDDIVKDEESVEKEKDEELVEKEKDEELVEKEKDEESVEKEKDEESVEKEKNEESVEKEKDEESVEKEKNEESVEKEKNEESVEKEKDEDSEKTKAGKQEGRRLSRNRRVVEENTNVEETQRLTRGRRKSVGLEETPKQTKGRKGRGKAKEEENEVEVDEEKEEAIKDEEKSEESEENDENEKDKEQPKPQARRGRRRKNRRRRIFTLQKRKVQSGKEKEEEKDEENDKDDKDEKKGEEDKDKENKENQEKKGRKRRRKRDEATLLRDRAAQELKLLGVTEDTDTPTVRQSRRIAQIKLKEEAERRRLEALQLESFKKENDKKRKKKKSKQDSDSGDDENKDKDDDDDYSDDELTKKERKRKKKKDKLKFNELNPWLSSTESSTVDEEEEELEDEPHEDDELVFKSDHEFSPESDVEDPDYKPIKRARTAKVEESEEKGGKYDDTACEKCGNKDHPEWILLCDKCDKGWHASCVRPALMVVPEGDWFCPPCEHIYLIEKLKESLAQYDRTQKQRENEELRRKRLAFVGISLDNVLPPVKKIPKEEREEDDEKSGSESSSESESSESDSGSSDSSEPVYQLRERRSNVTSYRYNEYDELIKSALKDEIEAVKGAGNAGRGKDINNIVNAEKQKENENSEEDKDEPEREERGTQEEKPKKSRKDEDGDYDVETEEENEEEDENVVDELPPVVPKNTGLKKKRSKSVKITSLDFTSEEEDDNNSDSDFKGTDDEEESECSLPSESDSSEEIGRRRKGYDGPVRRSTRARVSRYDRDFINDDSEDDEPKRKRQRSWDSSESSDSDRSWGRKKRKKGGSNRLKKLPSEKKKKKQKKRPLNSDDDDRPPKKHKSRKVTYGGVDEEPVLTRRTRGKKINYQEMNGSDSEDEQPRKTSARVIESDDDFVAENDKDEEEQNAESEEIESGVDEDENTDEEKEKKPIEKKKKILEKIKKKKWVIPDPDDFSEDDLMEEKQLDELNEELEDLDEEEEEILGNMLEKGDVPINELRDAVKRAKEDRRQKKEGEKGDAENLPRTFPPIPAHLEFGGGKFPKIGKIKITPSRAELASMGGLPPQGSLPGAGFNATAFPTSEKQEPGSVQGEKGLGDPNIPANHSKPEQRPYPYHVEGAPPAGPLTMMAMMNSQRGGEAPTGAKNGPPQYPYQGYPPNIPTTVMGISDIEAQGKKKPTPKIGTKMKKKPDDPSLKDGDDNTCSGDEFKMDVKGVRGRGKKSAEAVSTVQPPTQFPPSEGGSVITRMLNAPQYESNQFVVRNPPFRPIHFATPPRPPPIRVRVPGPMFHTPHPHDPSPSGGGPINIAPTKPAPPSPTFNRAPVPVMQRFPDPRFALQGTPTRPEFSTYGNYYGNYTQPEEPGFQNPPPSYPEQFAEGAPPPPKSFEDETGGEFGGLASYFASQREEDLDT